MNKFSNTFAHYESNLEKYGEDHPLTEYTLLLALHYAPEHVKAEIDAKAQELNLLPPVSGYTDAGAAIYSFEDIANYFGVSFELVELYFSEMASLYGHEGFVVDPNTKINRVQ